MNTKRLVCNFLLLLAALIWGCAFVAQTVAMDHVGPLTFQTSRAILGSAVLVPVIIVSDLIKKKKGIYKKPTRTDRKNLLVGGLLCGAVLTVAAALQQIGINLGTSSGKSGFITAMYILLVPVLGLFLKKKVRPVVWVCVGLGVIGLYLLCMKDGFSIAEGDIYTLLCAVCFSVHILVVDHFSPTTDGVKLSCLQFFTMFILSGIAMLIFEKPSFQSILTAWLPICYAGIMSCGIAYTLQIIGQKHTEPAVASLLMSFESVFAVLAGIIILAESPSLQEYIGSAIMFVAIIISQLPEKKV